MRAQVLPEVIERYSEDFLSRVIKGVIGPGDMDSRLRELPRRPDGRPLYEPL